MEKLKPRFPGSKNYEIQSVVSEMNVGIQFSTAEVIKHPDIQGLIKRSSMQLQNVGEILDGMQCVPVIEAPGRGRGPNIRLKKHDPRMPGQQYLCQGCHFTRTGTDQCIILFEDLRE